MADSCDPDALARGAKCFTCVEPAQQLAIQTYLLLVISGMSATPQQLVTAAKCFDCVPINLLLAINTYLLCQIAGGTTPSVLTQVFCGTGAPAFSPVVTCAIYASNGGGLWRWNGIDWLPLIAE